MVISDNSTKYLLAGIVRSDTKPIFKTHPDENETAHLEYLDQQKSG